jgi:predicted MFS family arabinose efflux permease
LGASISTIRQLVTPHQLLGRVTAVIKGGGITALTAGSFAGGLIADTLGLRATLVLGGVLPLVGQGWLLVSAIRRLRRAGFARYASRISPA